ncbi:MAG: hypothetical protein WAM11_11790 [Cyanobium sp.]
MTVLNSRLQQRPDPGAAGSPERALVLVGFGLAGAPAPGGLPPLPAVAQRLGALLELPIHRLSPLHDPNAALTALGRACAAGTPTGVAHQTQGLACGPGGLGLVEIDPGLPLPAGGSWVEALGAWRQPCLLVIAAGQLPCGWPAAGTALLQRWGVPLLGLLQWGGAWDRPARRRDGLPWLGVLAEPGDPAMAGEDAAGFEAALLPVLARRWLQLDLG